jgi:hypothetical protein
LRPLQDVTLLVEADAQYDDGGHNLAASLHHLVTLVEIADWSNPGKNFFDSSKGRLCSKVFLILVSGRLS